MEWGSDSTDRIESEEYSRDLAKENKKLEDNNKDLTKLVNAILDAITDKDMITRDILEDWGQELEHITHRVKL